MFRLCAGMFVLSVFANSALASSLPIAGDWQCEGSWLGKDVLLVIDHAEESYDQENMTYTSKVSQTFFPAPMSDPASIVIFRETGTFTYVDDALTTKAHTFDMEVVLDKRGMFTDQVVDRWVRDGLNAEATFITEELDADYWVSRAKSSTEESKWQYRCRRPGEQDD